MLTLFGPLLAQLVTVTVADRSEALVIANDGAYYQATTRPAVGLGLTEKALTLQFLYSPSFTLAPLNSEPRDLLVYQGGTMSGAYAWRRTTLTVGESFGYGEVNFQALALSGPVPAGAASPGNNNAGASQQGGGTATGGAGTATGSGASTASQQLQRNEDVRFGTSMSSARLTYTASPHLSLGAGAAYTVSGALDAGSRAQYPLVFGPVVSGNANQQLDRWNTVSYLVSLQYALASTGDQTWLSATTETWTHQFGPRVSTSVGAGIAAGRNSRIDGYVAYNISPTFMAGLAEVNQLHPGTLSLSLAAFSTPVLDPKTLAVDPRVALTGTTALQVGKFSMNLSGTGAFSVSGQQSSAFASAGAAAGVGFRFGTAVVAESGVRTAWQAYAGQTILAWTYAGFLAVTVSTSAPLR